MSSSERRLRDAILCDVERPSAAGQKRACRVCATCRFEAITGGADILRPFQAFWLGGHSEPKTEERLSSAPPM